MHNLNGFVTFAAIVDAGSFSLASERLGISKALASRHVADLERLLGVRLLNRTTRKLGLTTAGQVFYERCRQLIAHAEDARHELEQFREAPGGLLRVSTAMTFGRLHLVPAVAAFLARYPAMRVEIDLSERFADLVAGGADVVIRQADEPRLNSLVARRLATTRWVVCAAPAYLAARRPPRTPRDLAGHNAILYQSNSRGEWSFTSADGVVETVRVDGNYRANNADGIVEALVAGLGIGVAPSFATYRHLAEGRLVRLLPDWQLAPRVLYAAYLPDPHTAQRVQVLLRFLAERFGDTPYWDASAPADPGASA